jgi:hypothetical protein
VGQRRHGHGGRRDRQDAGTPDQQSDATAGPASRAGGNVIHGCASSLMWYDSSSTSIKIIHMMCDDHR